MSPLPQFPSPPPSSYQPYPDPQPPMSYFDNTQALIASLSDSMNSQFQIVQSQNYELKVDMNALKVHHLDLSHMMCAQMDALKCEMQAMRTNLQSHIHDTRTQHQYFQQQLESIQASSSTIPTTAPSPVISDEAIVRITEAIGDELHCKLKKISS